MTPRHPAFDYLQRLFQIMRIVTRQLSLLAVRRWRKQPTLGHLLLRDGLEQIGGTFVKLGQILSLQIDTLPANIATPCSRSSTAFPPAAPKRSSAFS